VANRILMGHSQAITTQGNDHYRPLHVRLTDSEIKSNSINSSVHP
jgi:hypothetical protein